MPSPRNPGQTSDGAGSLNLRGLNSKRTLQLLDGRRVVQSTIFGGPDINLFPSNVVRTVETVTGGATAAYGTDAVAGVTVKRHSAASCTIDTATVLTSMDARREAGVVFAATR